METHKNLVLLAFPSEQAWLTWLEENHTTSPGVWVKFAKKASGLPTVSYEEVREGALRYGWIDGQINAYDERFFLTRLTPRRPKSTWSKINCELVEQLTEQGKMTAAGLAHVESAKADGRWEVAYDSPSRMTVPDDFARALQAHPAAEEFFGTLSRANRYAFLYRIQTAKSEEVRAKRIAQYLEMLEEGRAYYPTS